MKKTDGTDSVYVIYEQIFKILPMLTTVQKGNRLFYLFSFPFGYLRNKFIILVVFNNNKKRTTVN